MELAEKRYAQWLAQQGLEPELRQELDAMHSDAEKVTDAHQPLGILKYPYKDAV